MSGPAPSRRMHPSLRIGLGGVVAIVLIVALALAQKACSAEPRLVWTDDEWPAFTVEVGHPALTVLRDSVAGIALPGRIYLRDSVPRRDYVLAHEIAHQRQYAIYGGAWPVWRKIAADLWPIYVRRQDRGTLEREARFDAMVLASEGVVPHALPLGRRIDMRPCRRPAFYQQCLWIDGALVLAPALVVADAPPSP